MPAAYKVEVHPCPTGEFPKHSMETGRLDSFDADWPHPDDSVCSRTRMAKAGFYYTGTKDYVKCFVCQVKLGGWEENTDEPWQKHAEAAPHCIFAKVGKEENHLTVEQWLDVFRDQAINKMDLKIKQLRQLGCPAQ